MDETVDSDTSTPPAQSRGLSPLSLETEKAEQATQSLIKASQPALPVINASRSPLPEYDYVDFDPEELRGQLSSTMHEIQQLKEAFKGLHSKHGELEQSWQQHNVKSANLLNFV
jgi:hypothetical protein